MRLIPAAAAADGIWLRRRNEQRWVLLRLWAQVATEGGLAITRGDSRAFTDLVIGRLAPASPRPILRKCQVGEKTARTYQ